MPPFVLLHHERPGEARGHFDLLIAPDDSAGSAEVRDLIHFAMDERPDGLEAGRSVVARRGPAHRRLYLTHEGPLPGERDRGRVRRVLAGEAVVHTAARDRVEVTIEGGGGGAVRLLALAQGSGEGSVWRVLRLP